MAYEGSSWYSVNAHYRILQQNLLLIFLQVVERCTNWREGQEEDI